MSVGAGVLSPAQEERLRFLRDRLPELDALPRPGRGGTRVRWEAFVRIARTDLSSARLVEGHADARAILHELGAPDHLVPGRVWGVWAAHPAGVVALRRGRGWSLRGVKPWCSGSTGLDRALLTATADDGPRLFVVDPEQLTPVAGSWEPIGMQASASHTMRVDVDVPGDDAVGGPGAYVGRPGFWHGGAGVAACWFGGAVAVLEAFGDHVARRDEPIGSAAYGVRRAELEAAGALLAATAREIDADPHDEVAARVRALRIRIAVEIAARRTVEAATVTMGAGALCGGTDHAERIADLQVYLRQLDAGAASAEYSASSHRASVSW